MSYTTARCTVTIYVLVGAAVHVINNGLFSSNGTLFTDQVESG